MERGDWPAATRGYQEMVELRVERNGYAAAQLGRVAIRPWAVRIRSVLVSPLRPDGVPWVGPPRPFVVRVANELARVAGGPLSPPFLMLLGQVPRENQPHVVIEVIAPGRRRRCSPSPTAASTPRWPASWWWAPTASSGAASSSASTTPSRTAWSRTSAVVEVPLGELVTRGGARLQAASVAALELTAEPADGVPPGSFSDLTPAPPPPQAVPPRPPGR